MRSPAKMTGCSSTLTTSKARNQSWKKAELNYHLAKQNKDAVLALTSECMSICCSVKKKNKSWGKCSYMGLVWIDVTTPPPPEQNQPTTTRILQLECILDFWSEYLPVIIRYFFCFVLFCFWSIPIPISIRLKTKIPNPSNQTFFMSHMLYPIPT